MKQKGNGTVSLMTSGLALGTMVSIVITLIGAVVSAAMISSETIPEGSTGYCALAVLLISAITGAIAGAGKVKEKRLYVCGMIGVIYFLILLATTALFFGGQYEGVGVTALVIFGGNLGACLLGMRGNKRPKLRNSKIRHR